MCWEDWMFAVTVQDACSYSNSHSVQESAWHNDGGKVVKELIVYIN